MFYEAFRWKNIQRLDFLIRFTLRYFKMTVMPLVTETKMADVGKLICFGNLLVRKVTWFVLTTTSATMILSRAFGADCMTRITYIYSPLPRARFFFILISRDNTLSLSPLQLTETTHFLSLSNILTSSCQPHENVYILQPFSFLFCFSVRLVQASNTITEILSNPERDKRPSWEKTHAFLHTLLYFYISMPYKKYLVHRHLLVNMTLLIVCLFP